MTAIPRRESRPGAAVTHRPICEAATPSAGACETAGARYCSVPRAHFSRGISRGREARGGVAELRHGSGSYVKYTRLASPLVWHSRGGEPIRNGLTPRLGAVGCVAVAKLRPQGDSQPELACAEGPKEVVMHDATQRGQRKTRRAACSRESSRDSTRTCAPEKYHRRRESTPRQSALREPLPQSNKPRLLGNWGTTPGLNLHLRAQ